MMTGSVTFFYRAQIAHIATFWDDQPFVTPTTYFYDETEHRLIFHSNIAGRIRANIEHHPGMRRSERVGQATCLPMSPWNFLFNSAVYGVRLRLYLEDRAGATRSVAQAHCKVFRHKWNSAGTTGPPLEGVETYLRLRDQDRIVERKGELEGSRRSIRRVARVERAMV